MKTEWTDVQSLFYSAFEYSLFAKKINSWELDDL